MTKLSPLALCYIRACRPPRNCRRRRICRQGDRDDDLVANSIDESGSRMPRLILRWSEGALREAFDSEAREVRRVVLAPRGHKRATTM